MGQIHKLGDIYYIEFFARGLMYTQPAGAREEDALRMLAEVEAKIAQGEALTIVREIDLIVFFEQYLSYAKRQFSLKSLQRFKNAWEHWTQFLAEHYSGVTKLSHITPSVLESYKMELTKTVKPRWVNLTILLLREILEYGIKTGFINDNPTLHIALMKLPQKHLGKGRRRELAQDLLHKGVSLGKVCELLKLRDIAQIMYWSNFIPLKREDVYN